MRRTAINLDYYYAVEANIQNSVGQLLFTNGGERPPAMTRGALPGCGGDRRCPGGGASSQATGATAKGLAGSKWQLILCNNGKDGVVSVNVPTITVGFGADGTVNGFGGCNEYGGPYKVAGDTIQVGPLVATQKSCAEPVDIMAEDKPIMPAVQSAVSYQV